MDHLRGAGRKGHCYASRMQNWWVNVWSSLCAGSIVRVATWSLALPLRHQRIGDSWELAPCCITGDLRVQGLRSGHVGGWAGVQNRCRLLPDALGSVSLGQQCWCRLRVGEAFEVGGRRPERSNKRQRGLRGGRQRLQGCCIVGGGELRGDGPIERHRWLRLHHARVLCQWRLMRGLHSVQLVGGLCVRNFVSSYP